MMDMEYSMEKVINIDDLLNLSQGGDAAAADDDVDDEEVAMQQLGEGNFSNETSTVSSAAVDSCNSSFSGDRCFVAAGAGLSGDLCEPQLDELAELEWISNYGGGEDSFSSEELQKLHIISPSPNIKSNTLSTNPIIIKPEPLTTGMIKTEPGYTVNSMVPSPSSSFSNRHATHRLGPLSPPPRKARSKQPRTARAKIWPSVHTGLGPCEPTDGNLEEFMNPVLVKKPVVKQVKKKDSPMSVFALAPPLSSGGQRRCLHCETDKTPQWRTGPMGPKTLCNACGVRYKSGRLVPEYRPAASPTFVVSKHSNSHRKVLELRRQKEMHVPHVQHHQHQQLMLHHGASPLHVQNPEDFLIHHQIGPDFRQLI